MENVTIGKRPLFFDPKTLDGVGFSRFPGDGSTFSTCGYQKLCSRKGVQGKTPSLLFKRPQPVIYFHKILQCLMHFLRGQDLES